MILEEKQIESRYIYKGKIINLRVDKVELPDGKLADREVVEHRGAVAVVARAPAGGVLLVKQYRHPVGETLWEIPAGKLEQGEAPEECARRELAEETGYYPNQLTHLGCFYTSPGFSSELIHLYLGEQLQRKKSRPAEGELVEAAEIEVKQALEMIKDGKIRDAKTVTGLLIAFGPR